MSKAVLKTICECGKDGQYFWSLFFFRTDKRNKQPYKVFKVRFKNANYLTTYATNLIQTVDKFQVEPISDVQCYDGENSKVSCDKIELSNQLISEQWTLFTQAVAKATDSKADGRINGYILYGQPSKEEDKPITFVKVANPITKLTNKKSVVFTTTASDELELISDDVCRLYLTIDFIVFDGIMYTFNHTFETIFNLEKTMDKVKNDAIVEILSTNAFSDPEEFKSLAGQYKSSRTFITLKEERVNRIKNEQSRKNVAEMLKLPLDNDGGFKITKPEEASLLLRYLCFKIFQDNETMDVLEANTVNKLNLA